MDVSVYHNRREVIDLKDYTFQWLSAKAREQGVNLKRYIEELLDRTVEDFDDDTAYTQMIQKYPDAKVMASEKETAEFEAWLGV